jgi:lipoprotein signal peptidase
MIWLLSALTVLLFDQASKALVLRAIPAPPGELRSRWPRLRPTLNRRAIGRWLHDHARGGRWALLLVWGIAVGGTVALLARYPLFGSAASRLGLGAALGGATSNLVDVLRRGAVVDYIDLRVWPVFNPADVAIFAGVGWALWTVW